MGTGGRVIESDRHGEADDVDGRNLRVVLAPDKFKGTLTAAEVIDAMTPVIRARYPRAEILAVPMADGGDGTLDAVLARGFERRECASVDGLGRLVRAPYAYRAGMAVVELAAICGLAVTGQRDVHRASSLGLGIVARQAVIDGATDLLVALGGSASVDGGLGFLVGLGMQAWDGDGQPVAPGLDGLSRVRRIDLDSIPREVRAASWRFLLDVANPLTGSAGAAAVFGPQKGLGIEEIPWADASLSAWATLLGVPQLVGDAGMGAAGGIALAGRAVLGASAEPGAPWIAHLVGLPEAIARASIVITGEGSFDAQSLSGKAPGEVIRMAREAGVPVRVMAGSVGLDEETWRAAGVDRVVDVSVRAGGVQSAMDRPAHWVAQAAGALL